MQYVAHRAGNAVASLRAAEGRVDLIELDVHRVGRHGVEIRHAKRLWPTHRLWERWYFLPAGQPFPGLDEILASAQPDTALWFDLKGVTTNLGPRLVTMASERPVVVSSKSWWLLARVAGTRNLRTFRSAGNRLELALLLWLPTRVPTDGAVVHRRLLRPWVLRRLQRQGQVFTWSVPDRDALVELERRGVDGVIVDDLDLVPARG